jgi:hypothetical protein
MDELKSKNKDGLSYSLIFQHGEQIDPSQVLYLLPFIPNDVRRDSLPPFNKQIKISSLILLLAMPSPQDGRKCSPKRCSNFQQ